MIAGRQLSAARAVALAAAAHLALGAPAAAQAPVPVPVQPGGIATVVARVSALPSADSVSFRMLPTAGIRVFGRSAGRAPVSGSGDVAIPFTVGVPAAAGAGTLLIGRVQLEWPGGLADSVDLAVEVARRAAASFWIGAETVTVAPGLPVDVGYRLRNGGNGTDTFTVTVAPPAGWEAQLTPARVVVAAGDTAAGTVRVIPPERGAPGQEALVRITLAGTGVRETRSLRVLLVHETPWLESLASLPARVFVGSSTDDGGAPGVSLHAEGSIRPGTRLSLAARYSDELDVPPAFRSRLGGPRLRLALETPEWGVRLGDLFTPAEVLTGPVSQSRGAEIGVRTGAVSGAFLLATPLSYGLDEESGLIARAAATVATAYGEFGVKAASTHRDSDLFGRQGRAGATATWALRRGNQEIGAEAGLLTVSGDSGRAGGFAARLRYSLQLERATLTARLRKVPATTRAAGSHGDEAFLSSAVRIASTASAVAWAFAAAAPYADGGPYGASRGGAAGLRFQLMGADADLLGTYRETDVVGDTLPRSITRTVRGSVDVPVGPLTLESDVEIGTIASTADRPYRQLRGGARWSGDRRWAWLGLSHFDVGIGAAHTGVDLAGALALRQVDLQGGLNLPLAGTAAGVSFWSGTTIPVTRDVSIAIGIDHRALDRASPWRFSLGASRAFGLPIPLPRHPVLHGVVFEDLDGNLRRDDGEPPVEGIPLLFGPLRARTDSRGAFRFYDRASAEPRLDPTRLPPGWVVPAEVRLPESGYVEIPVIRTATLQLVLFLDRDGDGERDPAEQLAEGVVVSIRDRAGRTRDAAADSLGRVRFGSLPPGPYTILAYPPTAGARQAPPPVEVPVTLAPGATVERRVAVPLRRREVRMPGGSG